MFYVKRVKNQDELHKIFSLRYQVYCLEKMFLDAKDYPEGLEQDQYDESAIHLGAFANGENIVGSLRLVRSTTMHFPMFDHCTVAQLPKDASSLEYAEISRLLISKKKRTMIRPLKQATSPNIGAARSDFTDFGISDLLMELFKVMFSHSKQRGIKYWLAAMEPSLMRLLQYHHFNFRQVGPATDYYGQVIPCIASLAEIEKQLSEKNYDFFLQFAKYMTDPQIGFHEETMWPPKDYA
ncbi:PEP-CTERM/exosortase system-associated acyltransferase [Undibacterium sp. Jales W-56]|uniref:PEP-CTERM/exosortase system-associated acyltransferase n=1 Tax=Undibacterium sp. Jales W-56 TaxID=2897325 RepID=UPI0021D1684B|nr:PEP-CTERM/exosortase system-associated acyltransferase [Undibacterium sp. Jales W-56]MCU6435572.1 PEP-CTERM/exosortase system-associated acyltransferase [Undibacterium sp. Jales W-56]